MGRSNEEPDADPDVDPVFVKLTESQKPDNPDEN